MDVLTARFGPRTKTITLKEVSEWKEKKTKLPLKPRVQSWSAPDAPKGVRLNDFYSSMEEQQGVVAKIKELLNAPPPAPSSPSFPASLESVISREAFERVQRVARENRVANHCMDRVIGVFFKTQSEVRQFVSLLKDEGIPCQTKEREDSLYEGVNILRVLYDPDSAQSNFVDVLQLKALHLSPRTINRLIRNAHAQKRTLFGEVKEELRGDQLSDDEAKSLRLLTNTITSLHDALLQYPGSYLLYQFYARVQELPLVMSDAARQSSLLRLLNELLYIEDGRSPLLQPPSAPASFNKLHDYVEWEWWS